MFRHWYRVGARSPSGRCRGTPRASERYPSPGGRACPRRRARLRLEELEGRYAPSVTTSITGGVLTVTSDNAGNTITVDHNAGTATTTVNGVSFGDSLFTSIQINGGHGHDTDNLLATPAKPAMVNNAAQATVNVGKAGSVQGILGPLSIENPPSLNTVTVDDSADPLGHVVTLDNFTPSGDSAFGRLFGLTSAPIEYEYADTAAITVKTSLGLNTVNVSGTGVPTTLVGEFTETVNVGSFGLVSGIGGLLTITNPPAYTALNVNNVADTGSHTVTMGVSGGVGFINGLAPQPIHYNQADVSAVTVTGGPTPFFGGGVNIYTVTNTVTNPTNPLTTLDVNDAIGGTVNVQATSGPLTVTSSGFAEGCSVGLAGSVQGIHGALTVNNSQDLGGGILLDDSADAAGRNVTVNDTSVVGLAPAVITYLGHTDVTIRGGGGTNTFTINGNSASGTFGTTLDPGSGASTVSVRGTTAPLFITNGSGTGRVTTTVGSLAPALGGTVANIHGEVETFQDGPDWALVVDDSGDATTRNVTVGGMGGGDITGLAPATISFPLHFSSPLTINGGRGGNTFTVTSFASSLLTLNTGPGVNTVNVQSVDGPVTVNGQSGPFDTVNLGEASDGTASIRGTVVAYNPLSNMAVTVNDQANPSGTHVTFTAVDTIQNVNGLGNPSSPFTLQYRAFDVSPLTINGGSRVNTYDVQAIALGSGGVILHTGSGNDTVNVGSRANTLDGILGPLTVDGQGGFNTLNINDQGETRAHSYMVTSTTVARSPDGPTITYSHIQSLTVHPGRQPGAGPTGSVVDVQGSAADTAVEVDAGGGATVNVGSDAGSLDDLQGPLSVVGDDGSVALNVNDQGSAAGQNYAIGDSTVTRTGAATISYLGVGGLALNAGAGGNQIDVQGLPFGTPAVVTAGPGGDLIRMRGGPVNAPLTLHGQGNTRLGYVAYTSPVFVDVRSGQATDVKGGFSGISGITGGQDLNILVGDGTQNLSGTPGSRNLLISGGGTGTLTGGGTGDILVGAATAYDADAHGELEAILAEWTSGAYADVVPHILAADTDLDPYPLNPSTVFDNGAQNTLIGHPAGGELNLYYVTNAEAGLYDATPDETVINVSGGAPLGGPAARLAAPGAASLPPAAAPEVLPGNALTLDQGNTLPAAPLVPPTRAAGPGFGTDWADAWQALPPWDGALR